MHINHLPLIRVLTNHLVYYPTPTNFTYINSFGVLAGIFLSIQILTGIFLAMHYTPEVTLAFTSVDHIMRDINYGWLLRYIHANGASLFFIAIFVHIFRGLYYNSYFSPRILLWYTGVAIFFVMMATAFMGYVLPWGQMSYWGATVITNLFSAIPVVGPDIAQWLWGGFAITNATLNRFFSLHYVLPFVIVLLVIIHLALLHVSGSNNALGINVGIDKIPFYPYFYIKDLFSVIVYLFVGCVFIYYMPNVLGHSDNYILANALVTPTHIVPEWYFLAFYAILRSIANKLGGVLFMGGAILVLIYITTYVYKIINYQIIRAPFIQFIHKILFWCLVLNLVLLTIHGSKPVEFPYTVNAFIYTVIYFLILIVFFYYGQLLHIYLVNVLKNKFIPISRRFLTTSAKVIVLPSYVKLLFLAWRTLTKKFCLEFNIKSLLMGFFIIIAFISIFLFLFAALLCHALLAIGLRSGADGWSYVITLILTTGSTVGGLSTYAILMNDFSKKEYDCDIETYLSEHAPIPVLLLFVVLGTLLPLFDIYLSMLLLNFFPAIVYFPAPLCPLKGTIRFSLIVTNIIIIYVTTRLTSMFLLKRFMKNR